MAKLSSRQRKHMPKSEFAGPDRSFPIPDASHARNALARVANKPEAEKAKVRAAVHRKFPSIGEGRDKKAKRTVRRSRSRA
jgi:hypothetical protein